LTRFDATWYERFAERPAGRTIVRDLVTIQAPGSPGQTPKRIELHDGESATFGPCLCGHCGLDLPLASRTSPWFAGQITATSGHWLLTNLCPGQTFLVENLESSYEYLTVEPGRKLAPIPFELARVVVADSPGAPVVTVFGPEPQHVTPRPKPCTAIRKPRPSVDRSATYFAVLQALCEPRLHGAATAPLPTSEEIARRLGSVMTARAVDAHIEYVTGKLGLVRGCGREVLVATAIRRRMVPR
jgi:hypothetical protein